MSLALAAYTAPLLGCAGLTQEPASAHDYPQLLDHLVWLAGDLDAACRQFEAMTGIAPAYGGRHGSGTHNALVALGPEVYLEIAAPQPGVTEGSPWIAAALARPEPHLLTYCMRSAGSLEALGKEARTAGLRVLGPGPGSRALPDGRELKWRLLIPLAADRSGSVPFFVDWMDSEHPAHSAARGARLTSFRIHNPAPAEINPLLARLAPGVAATGTTMPYLSARISSSKGIVTLTS